MGKSSQAINNTIGIFLCVIDPACAKIHRQQVSILFAYVMFQLACSVSVYSSEFIGETPRWFAMSQAGEGTSIFITVILGITCLESKEVSTFGLRTGLIILICWIQVFVKTDCRNVAFWWNIHTTIHYGVLPFISHVKQRKFNLSIISDISLFKMLLQWVHVHACKFKIAITSWPCCLFSFWPE